MVSAPNTLLTARLGDSFYFAVSKIVESLLRRGARGFSLYLATQTQQKPLWGRSALESWSWLGNRRELPLRRAGGASRHPVLPVLRNFLARMASKTPNGCERHRAKKPPPGRRYRNPAENPTKKGHERVPKFTQAPAIKPLIKPCYTPLTKPAPPHQSNKCPPSLFRPIESFLSVSREILLPAGSVPASMFIRRRI